MYAVLCVQEKYDVYNDELADQRDQDAESENDLETDVELTIRIFEPLPYLRRIKLGEGRLTTLNGVRGFSDALSQRS